jgi:two-component system chemotaxis response regulator CheB
MAPQPANHDIIVIGASLGGVEALQQLAQDLPPELPAAVFVVLHIGGGRSQLAAILDRAGPLPARQARGGEPIERGRIYVAPPDRHLLVHDGHVLVRRGPHENLSRPAIDPLFRSAACSHGSRVIGVVLSGALTDGTAGMIAVKRCGGVAVIQDPADAVAPEMPRSARRYAAIDEAVPIAAMGGLLAQLAARPAGPQPEIPADICFEAAIAAQELDDMPRETQIGAPSPFTCPECGGGLWELADGGMLRYRCHLGHAFTADAMQAAQSGEVEQLLTRLLRSHRDRAELTRRLAERERMLRNDDLATKLETRAREYDENAALMQKLLANVGSENSDSGGADDG